MRHPYPHRAHLYRHEGIRFFAVCRAANRSGKSPRNGGREIAPTRYSCQDLIHNTWTHNELRDDFNDVEKIRADDRFQKFFRWLYKQDTETVFKSWRDRTRADRKYR